MVSFSCPKRHLIKVTGGSLSISRYEKSVIKLYLILHANFLFSFIKNFQGRGQSTTLSCGPSSVSNLGIKRFFMDCLVRIHILIETLQIQILSRNVSEGESESLNYLATESESPQNHIFSDSHS